MTAFDSRLVAISLRHARYSVHSQIYGGLNEDALRRDGLIHDVSENSSYIDEAAILQRLDVPKYFFDNMDPETLAWFDALPEDVFFVIYHIAQFESGLGD